MKQMLTLEATQITSNSWGLLPLETKYDLSTHICTLYVFTRIIFFSSGSKPLWWDDIYIKKAHNQINESLWADAIILINDKKCMVYKHLK